MNDPDPAFKPDCENCVALCCVAPHFAPSDTFAFAKPEGTPCRHLGGDFRCTIHDKLAESGFRGCVEYDCFGAGQKVTRRFAAEGNWRGDESLRGRMFAVYHVVRPLHELMVYLNRLRGLTADETIKTAIETKRAELAFLAESGETVLRETDIAAHKAAVETLIARVRDAR
jgi:hypothetical protein